MVHLHYLRNIHTTCALAMQYPFVHTQHLCRTYTMSKQYLFNTCTVPIQHLYCTSSTSNNYTLPIQYQYNVQYLRGDSTCTIPGQYPYNTYAAQHLYVTYQRRDTTCTFPMLNPSNTHPIQYRHSTCMSSWNIVSALYQLNSCTTHIQYKLSTRSIN